MVIGASTEECNTVSNHPQFRASFRTLRKKHLRIHLSYRQQQPFISPPLSPTHQRASPAHQTPYTSLPCSYLPKHFHLHITKPRMQVSLKPVVPYRRQYCRPLVHVPIRRVPWTRVFALSGGDPEEGEVAFSCVTLAAEA